MGSQSLSRRSEEAERAAVIIQSSFRGHYARRLAALEGSMTSFDFNASNTSFGYGPQGTPTTPPLSPSIPEGAIADVSVSNSLWESASTLVGKTVVALQRRNSSSVDEDDGIAGAIWIRGFGAKAVMPSQ